jgi:hypothetical protein
MISVLLYISFELSGTRSVKATIYTGACYYSNKKVTKDIIDLLLQISKTTTIWFGG